MTAVERLARELYRVGTIAGNPHRRPDQLETWESRPEAVKIGFLAAARHVLRRERRARGRTIWWCKVPTFDPRWAHTQHGGYADVVLSRKQLLASDCRVVAMPKPKKGGRK